MLNLVKIISTAWDASNRLLPKFFRLGKSDVQTAKQVTPFGIDSNPLPEMRALYAQTGENGQTCIIGYIQEDMIAEPGEVRLFAIGGEGNVVNSIHISNAGNIFIGVEKPAQDNTFVRYNELNIAITQLTTEFNAFVTAYNAHTHIVTAPTLPTLTAVPPAVPTTATIAGSGTPKIFTT